MKLPRPRSRTLAIVAASVLVGFALLYGVGVNLLLSTGGLAHLLSRKPEKLRVEYTSARTLWPGRVHVEGLDLRGRDAHMEWQLRIDSADATIALLPLLGRRFHVESISASGVSFRARFRMEAKDVTDDRIARIPPIAGFDAVPLRNLEQESIDEREHREPFTVELENATVEGAREIWIDSFRLAGEMTAAGGFQLGPHHLLEVFPTRMNIHEARLSVAEDPILTGLSGALDAVLASMNVRETKGTGVFRFLTTHSGFTAHASGLRFLRHFVEEIGFEGGAGTFSGLLVMEEGVVKKGSSSHVELGPLTVTADERSFEGSTTADLTVGEDDSGPWGRADVALSSVAFSEPKATRPAITSPRVLLGARIAETDLAAPPHDAAYVCDAPRAEIEDLRWIEEHLPKDGPFHFESGKAAVSLLARGTTKEVTADVGVVSALAFRYEGARAATDLDAKVHARAVFKAKTLDLSGTVLEMKGLAAGKGPARPEWSGKIKLDPAEIRLSPPSFTATVATTARDGRPLLSFYSAMRETSPALTTALAILPDPLVESMTAGLHGGLRLALAKNALELHALDVRGAQTVVQGELSKRGASKTGGFLFVAGPASVGVSFEGDKTSPVLVDAQKWFQTSVAHPKSP